MKNYTNKKKKVVKIPAWYTLFMKNSGGFSSKRVIAILGILICFGLLITSFITGIPVPEFGEIIFIGCISLYGIDVVPGFWSKSINKS